MESVTMIKCLWKSLVCCGFIAVILSGCNSEPARPNDPPEKTPEKTIVTRSGLKAPELHSADAQKFNNILLAELYSQLGDAQQSAKYYQQQLSISRDPAIARRATILAATTEQQKEALYAARIWVELMPQNLEAQQYLALLLLRNNEYDACVEQLQQIRQLIENENDEQLTESNRIYSRGLKFIGSMLNIESHHQQSLIAFQQYIKKYGKAKDQLQQNLIISSLAMNAEKYQLVVSALDKIKEPELISSSKITLMKVKALQKLGRIDEAIPVLQNLVDKQQVSDSHRLQLVRLLILNDQKNVAGSYLKDLVRKYPDNNDLLKSLIALQIDQSDWKNARKNIKKLSRFKDYRSDVAYFRGEIFEANGNLELALEKYRQVVNGSLKKRAIKKINQLNNTLQPSRVNYKKNQGIVRY